MDANRRALAVPAPRQPLEAGAMEVAANTPAEFRAYLEREHRAYQPVGGFAVAWIGQLQQVMAGFGWRWVGSGIGIRRCWWRGRRCPVQRDMRATAGCYGEVIRSAGIRPDA